MWNLLAYRGQIQHIKHQKLPIQLNEVFFGFNGERYVYNISPIPYKSIELVLHYRFSSKCTIRHK